MADILRFPSSNTLNLPKTTDKPQSNHVSNFKGAMESPEYFTKRLSVSSGAVLAQNILNNTKKLHAQGEIDTSTFNKCIHMFSSLANGIEYTEPEPPLAS